MGCIDCQKNPQTVELHGGVGGQITPNLFGLTTKTKHSSAHLHPNHPFTDATFHDWIQSELRHRLTVCGCAACPSFCYHFL